MRQEDLSKKRVDYVDFELILIEILSYCAIVIISTGVTLQL